MANLTCKYCQAESDAGIARERPREIPYVTPKGEGVCEIHRELLRAVGIQLDRAEQPISRKAILEDQLRALFPTHAPSTWTHDPFQTERKGYHRGH